MQNGGCHPVDGCQDGDGVRRRGLPVPRRERRSTRAPTRRSFPPYEIKKIDNAKIAFIGLTLEGTPTIVTPSGVAGLEFRPRSRPSTRSSRSCATSRASRRSSSSCTRAASRTRRRARVPATRESDAYTDVNKCVNFSGAEITAIANGLDPRVNVS